MGKATCSGGVTMTYPPYKVNHWLRRSASCSSDESHFANSGWGDDSVHRKSDGFVSSNDDTIKININAASAPTLGKSVDNDADFFSGEIRSFRITKGIAVYNRNDTFVPPMYLGECVGKTVSGETCLALDYGTASIPINTSSTARPVCLATEKKCVCRAGFQGDTCDNL